MIRFESVLGVVFLYGAVLFAVAWVADRRARSGRGMPIRPALVYTLSLSVYCTGWTFYGAAGYAARSGLEYLTIYLGPVLVLTGWWLVLRRMVRLGREARITSIADMVSSRFGKSEGLAALVTVLSVVAVTPYIALQLQSVTLSLSVFAHASGENLPAPGRVALWAAAALAVFTILFGTRSIDADERQHGVVSAIAIEAVVKLVALIAVGVFAVWGLGGGLSGMASMIDASSLATFDPEPGRWVGLTVISALAVLTLPRMFHVLVVESPGERALATAGWAFPLYLLVMSACVVPITVAGLALLPDANPDLYVLTLPLDQDRPWLAMLAFLGGLSAATSMVIVATIALAIMVSNHLVLPVWLSLTPHRIAESGDLRMVLLIARRASIIAVLAMGYVYFRATGGGAALASIGTIAFIGIAQIAPALFAGLYWPGANARGAALGLSAGFVIWAWCLALPSAGVLPDTVVQAGPFGLAALRPHALFGSAGLAPDLHAALWALSMNTALMVAGSLLLPARRVRPAPRSDAQIAASQDLLTMAQRLLGEGEARAYFDAHARAQGRSGLPLVTPRFLTRLERRMAASVGAAAAHAMVGQIAGGARLSVEELFAVADEAQQTLEATARAEAHSRAQAATAEALREANDKLTQVARQRDLFLGQVSHELRTPITSIRAFSDLLSDPDLPADKRLRFAGIIRDEALRLTRLLDDLLDLSVLENGQGVLQIAPARLDRLLDRAEVSAGARGLRVLRDRRDERVELHTDADRLTQVFINLIGNAGKYCDAARPELRISVRAEAGALMVDFIDNGSGIPEDRARHVFEKFARASHAHLAPGAGLGLPICAQIMARLGGAIDLLPGQGGAAFRVTHPAGPQAPHGTAP